MASDMVFPKECKNWKLKYCPLYIHPRNGRFIEKSSDGYSYLPYGTKIYPITSHNTTYHDIKTSDKSIRCRK